MTLTLIAPAPVLFKVHKNGSPLVWPVNNKHGVFAFRVPEHALYVAMVTESHYKAHKEWPHVIEFSYQKEVIPTILGVEATPYDELKSLCAVWNLNLIVVNDIDKKRNKFTFTGNIESFDLEHDARVSHLDLLFRDPGFSIENIA
jgi:hypothetical protein